MATTYRIGYLTTDTPGNVVQATTGNLTITAGNYQTLQTLAAANYQVTAGKTWYVGLILWFNAAANATIQFGYGDTAVANSAAPPTNDRPMLRLAFPTALSSQAVSVMLAVPASKFPYINAAAVASSSVYCTGVEI